MQRRKYVQALGATVVTGAFAGCAGNGNGGNDGSGGDDGSETGLLSTSVTDQPNDIADFESLVITIDGIWVKPDEGDDDEADDGGEETDDGTDGNETNGDADEETNGDADEEEMNGDEDDEEVDVDESAGRRYVEFEEPQEADLVLLQGDESQLIDETELEVGDYGFLQLDVAGTTGILEADGEEADVETPGNAPLQFQQAFEIRPDERTRFVADFAPFRIGPPDSGRYLIRPVTSGTRVIYGDDGDDDGTDGNADEDGGAEPDGDTETDPGTNETED